MSNPLKLELLSALDGPIRAGRIAVLAGAARLVANTILVQRYPFVGTWPDWNNTRNHQHLHEPCGDKVRTTFSDFFDENLADKDLERAFYANDGVPVMLESDVATFRANLEVFVDTMHTSYFLAADGAWCLSLRMNGQMDFGEALAD